MDLITNNLEHIIKVVVISLFFFVLVREVICWYFKINERISVLKETVSNQVKIIGLLKQYYPVDLTSKHHSFHGQIGKTGDIGGDGVIHHTRDIHDKG